MHNITTVLDEIQSRIEKRISKYVLFVINTRTIIFMCLY